MTLPHSQYGVRTESLRICGCSLPHIQNVWLDANHGVRSTNPATRRILAYARVSSRYQKEDLERQKQVFELCCARQGWTFEVVTDLGSEMNDHKKGLKKLLAAIIAGSDAHRQNANIWQ